jgi:hypothetical protein
VGVDGYFDGYGTGGGEEQEVVKGFGETWCPGCAFPAISFLSELHLLPKTCTFFQRNGNWGCFWPLLNLKLASM